jgi:uncharacterized damage-inducible protein DinB
VPLNALLTGYLSGVSTLASFLTLPDELLYRRPAPEAWSAGEVIHHLADADIAWSMVFRRVVVERQPAIELWDETRYCERLRYAKRPLLQAISTVTALRHANVDLFASLRPQQWRRTAIHPDAGPMTLRELVLLSTEEMAEGLAQARRAVNGAV